MLHPGGGAAGEGVLVLVGTNPVVSHGYGTTLPDPIRHLRDYRGRGGRVWVLDPRGTETAAHADAHLAGRPGTDAVVRAAIARSVLADVVDGRRPVCASPADLLTLQDVLAPFTVDRAARTAGVDAQALQQLVDEIGAGRGGAGARGDDVRDRYDHVARRRAGRVAALGRPRADRLARPTRWHGLPRRAV